MTDPRPTVLLDIDGVTLDWFHGLPAFVQAHGLGNAQAMERFHQGMGAGMVHLDELFGAGTLDAYHASSFGRTMPPLETPATLRVLQAIAEHHRIVAITAFSDQPALIANRRANLDLHFPGLFEEVHSVAAFSPKRDKLVELAGRHNVVLFVDDSRKHVQEGLEVLGQDKVVWFRGDAQQQEVRVARDWAHVLSHVEERYLTRELPPSPPRRRRLVD